MKGRLDILFIQGLEPIKSGFIGYVFPLASQLELNNYTFKILDAFSLPEYSIERIVSEIENIDPRTIGLTTNSDNIPYVHKVCKAIKEKLPNTPIMLGGPQVTHSDEDTLNSCCCDVVIRGHGDYSLIGILDVFIRKKYNLEDIDGISFKKNDKLVRNRESIIDINKLPIPQYKVLREKKYWIVPQYCDDQVIEDFLKSEYSSYNYFLTGRGCPFTCAFCVEGNKTVRFHYKKIENVKKDLLYFISVLKPKMLYVSDDTFTATPKRVRGFCKILREIQSETYPFTWFAEARVDILSKNTELIGEMYETGLLKLQLGVESGLQKTLDAYNKRITLEQIETVIKECKKYEDLRTFGNIMLANPHESFDEYLETINFFEKLIVESDYKFDFNIIYLCPFVGTPIRSNPEKYGLEIIVDDFEFNAVSMSTPICKPKKMTLKELYSLRPYTRTRIMEFVRSKISNLPSREIREILRLNKLHNSAFLVYDQFFKRYNTIGRYATLTSSGNAVLSYDDNDLLHSIPVRLWNIEHSDDIGYYFMALNSKKRVLNNAEVLLWRLASGKNSVQDIYKIISDENNIETRDILRFYKEMENKLAIFFRKY